MNDDLDQNLADSLHRRAHEAPTDGQHFGDVRRRVRRRRQRHMAMGVAPALIGMGYLATRPVAEPTQSADSVDSTWLGDATTILPAMASSTTWLGNELGYRCLAMSGYDLGDGYIYYDVCEAGPAMTGDDLFDLQAGVPFETMDTTTMLGNYTTTIEYYPTTSDNGGQLPTNVATTTTDPSGSAFDPNSTSTTQVP